MRANYINGKLWLPTCKNKHFYEVITWTIWRGQGKVRLLYEQLTMNWGMKPFGCWCGRKSQKSGRRGSWNRVRAKMGYWYLPSFFQLFNFLLRTLMLHLEAMAQITSYLLISSIWSIYDCPILPNYSPIIQAISTLSYMWGLNHNKKING